MTITNKLIGLTYKMCYNELIGNKLFPVIELSQFTEDKVTWLEVDNEKTFTCWVCRKYPSVANNDNKVFVGTNKCTLIIRSDMQMT